MDAEPERQMLSRPMPGRFVVDVCGVVDVDPKYRYRPKPEKTVEDVRALK